MPSVDDLSVKLIVDKMEKQSEDKEAIKGILLVTLLQGLGILLLIYINS